LDVHREERKKTMIYLKPEIIDCVRATNATCGWGKPLGIFLDGSDPAPYPCNAVTINAYEVKE
jgi:hypothetical protein